MDRVIRWLGMASLGWLVFALPLQAQTDAGLAQVRFVGPAGLVRQGEIFTVAIQLESAGQKINAAEIRLAYPTDRLEVIYVSREQSIFTLWPEPPAWEAGFVTLTGGRPGGLYALNAAVATVYFRAIESGPAVLSIDPAATAAYLHDGHGTRLPIAPTELAIELASDLVPGIALTSTTHPTPEFWSHGTSAHVGWVVDPESQYSYAFGTDPAGLPDDTPEGEVGSVEYIDLADGVYYFTIKQRSNGPWSGVTQRRFLIDGTPPELFTVELLPARSLGGARRISWTAVDQTSGVARSILSIGQRTSGDVTSPLAVDADWWGETLTITVVDAAGNVARSSLRLPAQGAAGINPWWLVGIAGVIAISLVGKVLRSRRASR